MSTHHDFVFDFGQVAVSSQIVDDTTYSSSAKRSLIRLGLSSCSIVDVSCKIESLRGGFVRISTDVFLQLGGGEVLRPKPTWVLAAFASCVVCTCTYRKVMNAVYWRQGSSKGIWKNPEVKSAMANRARKLPIRSIISFMLGISLEIDRGSLP